MVFSQHASNSPLIMHFIWTIMPMFNFKDHFSKNSQRVFGSWEKHNVPPAVTDATTLLWSWFSLDMGDMYNGLPLAVASCVPVTLAHLSLSVAWHFMYCNDFCFQDPFFLEKAIICCEQDWEQEYFEIHEFGTKDSYIFKVSFTSLFNEGRLLWLSSFSCQLMKISFEHLV